jgi:hypothetical protein
MKNRKRESCTSGTVRDEDGNILIYSARPQEGGAVRTGGRRTQTSRGGNRGRGRGWRGLGYGDLGAADEVGEWSRGGPANRRMVKRPQDERRAASNSVICRRICDDRRMSGRTLPWPMERQRMRRADLRDCEAVMRYRAC